MDGELTPFAHGYYETDYGRFDSALVRQDENGEYVCVGVACCFHVRPGKYYDEKQDKEVLEAFARYYDVPVKWQ